MQKKMSKMKIIVYVMIGLVVLGALVAAAIYLPGLMQALHGVW